MLISAVLMTMVIGVGYKFFIHSQQSFKEGETKYRVQHEAQKMIEWLKLDLLHSCKLNIGDKILIPGKNSYSFYRFTDAFSGDHPVMTNVTYIHNLVTKKVLRKTSSGEMEVGKDIEKLTIFQYFLNRRYYFRIEVVAKVSGEETKLRDMEIELRTSVESRFENNMINQA